jgi:hypothetical protein
MVPELVNSGQPGQLALMSTGDPDALCEAAQRWLNIKVTAQRLTL